MDGEVTDMKRLLVLLAAVAVSAAGLLVPSTAQAADIIGTVPTGTLPWGVAITPDGETAYVSNRGSNDVTVVSLETNSVAATIPVQNFPQGVAVSPDGSRVYVANRNSNSVSVINTATNTVATNIPVPGGPTGLAFTPDGAQLLVTRFNAAQVSAIDTATLTVAASAAVGVNPNSVAVTSDGAFAFTANRGGDSATVLALPALSPVATVPVGPEPFWVVATGRGPDRRAYVTNFGAGANSVKELGNGPGGWAVLRDIPVPGRPIGAALSRDRATLYVTGYNSGNVAAVRLANGSISSTTPVAPGLVGIAVGSDGSRAVVVRFTPAPYTATVFSLVPRVNLAPAQDVKGKTATGRATVVTDGSAATDIKCLFATEESSLADPYTSPAASQAADPDTAGANASSAVECPFTGLTRGTEYFYTALATDPDGIGAASDLESFITKPPKPAKPAVKSKRKALKLTWSDTRSADYYQSRIKKKGGSYGGWKQTTKPKVKHKKLSRKTAYKVQIRAGNESGTGPKRGAKASTK